nr:NADH dehydrogenase subunit 3 [Ancylostoma sp. HL-2021]
MLNLLLVVFFTLFLLLMLYLLNFFLSIKKNDLLKINAFESGFISVGKIQNSFSIHFFIMMLMFVIFDLEIVMFLGLLVSDFSSFISFLMLMFFIFGGFYMEWWYGKLVWVI